MADDVVVRVDRDPAGLVRISAPDSEAPRQSKSWVIPVSGGRVSIDLDHLDAPPRASLHDPGWAQTWLTEVYGAELAQAVASGSTGSVPYRPGGLTAPLVRLGVGLWLRRWWPAEGAGVPPLDEDLHEIELAALAWRLEACLVDLAWPAEALRDRRAELVAAVQATRQHGTGRRGELVNEVLTRALHASVSLTDDASEAAAKVRAARAERVAMDRLTAGQATGDWSLLFAELSRELPMPALVHKSWGGDDTEPRERTGTTTADWRQLPPRTVSGREGSVTWLIAGDRLEAKVDPALGLTVLKEPLQARFDIDGLEVRLPLNLSQDADGTTRLGGTAVLGETPAAGAALTVDVVSIARATTPRTDAAGLAEARDERAEIVNTIARRVANVPNLLDEPTLNWRAPFVAELLGRQWDMERI